MIEEPDDAHRSTAGAHRQHAAGEGIVVSKSQITSYGTGRSCSAADCDTRLSIYNSGASCAVHTREAEAARLAPRLQQDPARP